MSIKFSVYVTKLLTFPPWGVGGAIVPLVPPLGAPLFSTKHELDFGRIWMCSLGGSVLGWAECCFFLEICMWRGHNSCEMTSKGRGKNFRSLLRVREFLMELLHFSKALKKIHILRFFIIF